jgi:Fe-S-cluster containining protein
MGGIRMICRMYGRMVLKDKEGNEVVWVWDYAKEEPRREKEMSKAEKLASDKAKGELIKKHLNDQ